MQWGLSVCIESSRRLNDSKKKSRRDRSFSRRVSTIEQNRTLLRLLSRLSVRNACGPTISVSHGLAKSCPFSQLMTNSVTIESRCSNRDARRWHCVAFGFGAGERLFIAIECYRFSNCECKDCDICRKSSFLVKKTSLGLNARWFRRMLNPTHANFVVWWFRRALTSSFVNCHAYKFWRIIILTRANFDV